MTLANRPKRVVVVGSTFGRMYLKALSHCRRPVITAGLLTRGSERSRLVADTHSIALWSSVEEVPDDIDLACIAVRADSVGGTGTTLARRFLERGVSVLHELPASREDVAACLRAAQDSGAQFAVADLYRWLPAVRAFRAAARELLAVDEALAVDAHLSIQPAYTLARLLTETGLSLRPISLRASRDGTLVSGSIGGTPIAVRYATVLDARDTDNDVRFPSLSVHTRTGTLTLVSVHGPVLWVPTLHLPQRTRDSADSWEGNLAQAPASIVLFHGECTYAQILTCLWPQALARQIEAMFEATSNALAQRTLQVAELWEALTSGAQFPAAVDDKTDDSHHVHLEARLRAAVAEETSPEEGRN